MTSDSRRSSASQLPAEVRQPYPTVDTPADARDTGRVQYPEVPRASSSRRTTQNDSFYSPLQASRRTTAEPPPPQLPQANAGERRRTSQRGEANPGAAPSVAAGVQNDRVQEPHNNTVPAARMSGAHAAADTPRDLVMPGGGAAAEQRPQSPMDAATEAGQKSAPAPEAAPHRESRASRVSETGSVVEAPPAYQAYAFNDLESGGPGPGASNKTGMLGYNYKRQTSINWLGWVLFLFYLGALGFYLFVRISKTLGLGKFTAYGIVLLVVEVMGATTVINYGLNLLWNPVHEKFLEDREHPGLPLVKLRYHIRVMVPCYKEDIDIIKKTVEAAAAATLPAGCSLTIYLCDDGKDPEKRKWMQSLGPDFIYVSGRKRKSGEMNGKSGNLNNACRQVYPDGIAVPGNELICVFDADQVASKNFFLRMVPLFDGGDDVAMVLSPQCFHNLNMHTDIFNHSNIHFWEYMQPGYDAMGFISCTGTNFLIRAKAFQEVGWSPTYTLTEDFALGMELKKYGWQCRYVQEYLAIGEAPDQIRNCFQQRSRWTKGHFQIMFNPVRCPLFQWRLSLFDRIMYCSGVWSYFVGSISTPMYTAIPIITIWIGVFPVVISRWLALGLTIYSAATIAIQNYVRQPSHIEALWFANIANNLLWWAYVKAAWRMLWARIFCCCSKVTFKATAKGKGRLANSIVGDIWLHALFFSLLAITIGIAIWQLVTGAAVISPLLISILWAVYAAIPPFLLLVYAVTGPNIVMHFVCKLTMLVSFGACIGAIVIVWLIDDYNPTQFSGGIISQKEFGVLGRYINSATDKIAAWG